LGKKDRHRGKFAPLRRCEPTVEYRGCAAIKRIAAGQRAAIAGMMLKYK
jgi:hypothetical protein